MTEQNITEDKKVDAIDSSSESAQLNVENNVEELKDAVIASDVAMPNIDYLDKKILEMKTISLDELNNHSSQDEIDESIYDSAVLDIKQNRIVDGKVINITDKCVFVDIGFKSEGMISKDEFQDMPSINESIKVYIKSFEDSKGNFILSKQKADFEIKWNEIREIFDNDGLIKGKIIKRIKGGMVVELGVVQGFLPGSQIEIYSVTDFDKYIDMELKL